MGIGRRLARTKTVQKMVNSKAADRMTERSDRREEKWARQDAARAGNREGPQEPPWMVRYPPASREDNEGRFERKKNRNVSPEQFSDEPPW